MSTTWEGVERAAVERAVAGGWMRVGDVAVGSTPFAVVAAAT